MREPDEEMNLLTSRVIAVAIEVHRSLGPGYIESIYEKALRMEFELQGIPFLNQYPIKVLYKGSMVGEGRLDFLIDKRLIVEIKSVAALAPVHFTQVKSYLKALELDIGLLINFNEVRLVDGIRRVISTSR